jgi:2-keto-4-pentenoate hydratase/2-oxohepta-3-ene-1,7-dioic acid hydratase in catechol pathway
MNPKETRLKLVSFNHAGQASYGLVDGDRYLQPSADFLVRHPDLASVLRAGALAELEQNARDAGTALRADDVRALPVIPNPSKFICVGLNYKTHVAETKRGDSEHPSLFLRFNDTLAADGDEVLRPPFSERFDWEGELALVIGKGGRHIPKAQAFEHIAGFACLATRDEVPDVGALTLETRVNGEVMQHASVGDLIFDIPTIIEYVSRFTPLSPGDVIATGTPGGVGDRREPPRYMKEGDVVEVEITGLGILRNRIGTDA